MKININGYIKNIQNNTFNSFKTKGIKQNNKISYINNNEKYLLLINNNKIELTKETNESKSILYFELNKEIPSKYFIKENNLELLINIKTTKLTISNKSIIIDYIVTDSKEEFEYKIEMSD